MVAFTIVIGGALFAQAWAILTPSQNSQNIPAVVSSAAPIAVSTSLSVAAAQIDKLSELAYQATADQISTDSDLENGGECTLERMRVRRDWRDFSYKQRKSYIQSVLCLQKLPSQTPSDLVPGARSRYDDFVATHINQTQTIHFTGTFLAWHRYYVWNFEQALRNECGYTGDYP